MPLKYNPNIKYFHIQEDAWFNIASIMHLVFGILFFLTIKIYFISNTFWCFVVSNILHCIEDLVENLCTVSIEHIWQKLVGCDDKLFKEPVDTDSLQNFFGDIICCFIGTILGIYIYNQFEDDTIKIIVKIGWIVFCLSYIPICYKFFRKQTK